MSNYSCSIFNLFVPFDDNRTIVYNSFSGCVGLLENNMVDKIKNTSLSDEELNELLKRHFLVNSEFDELEEVNKIRNDCIDNKTDKLFRIWTTSACNANCFYCFEKGIPIGSMSKSTADRLIIFIDKILNTGEKLSIEWFGGEPLLNIDIIDYLSIKLVDLCNQKNCSYSSSIITNGSIINESIAHKMKTIWRIDSVQITLDGYRDDYNKIKDYNSPQIYNYDTVIDSIKLLINNSINVGIRINYTKSNLKSIVLLLEDLKKSFEDVKKLHVYIHPIWSSLNTNDKNRFITSNEADENMFLIFDKMIELDFCSLKECLGKGRKKYACASCLEHTYTIYPDGKIGKCCESFCYPIGDIHNGITEFELKRKWDGNVLDDECINCVFLPRCQGGCNTSRVNSIPKCFPLKDVYPSLLKWYINKKINN